MVQSSDNHSVNVFYRTNFFAVKCPDSIPDRAADYVYLETEEYLKVADE